MPRFVMIGLCFSLIGDFFLMVNEMSSFTTGTLFFMVAHTLYIVAFMMGEEIKELEGEFKIFRRVGYLIIVLLLTGNTYSLW